jgi:hypothetical protein|tara:strand:+ start:9611 stop:9994 length:384 start_codon:yes stop_codon:yes gene_type:complete
VEQSEIMIGWCAGLFDGEGNVNYAQYRVKNKNHKKWNVALEIAMTDLETVQMFHNVIREGTIHHKQNKGLGRKPQWRWRCSHQQALRVAKKLIKYSTAKRDKLMKIINHYEFKKAAESLRQKSSFFK